MNRRRLDRRRFLQAVGATALTYPFLRALPSFAAGPSSAKYLVLVFTPCGVLRDYWGALSPQARPTTGVVATPLTGATGAGAFRQTLMPFATGAADLSKQMTLLDGLNVVTAAGSHEAGMAALWTGIRSTGSAVSGLGMSIDQQIAQSLKAPTPLASLPLMVRDSQDFTERSVKTRMCYDASDFIDPYDDPIAARAAVFQQTPATDGGASAQDPKTAIRNAVFAQMNNELTGIQSKLCTEDRTRLAHMQDAFNALSSQFAALKTAVASCPQQPGVLTAPLDFPTAAQAQMDLAALAMLCDLTRVVTIQFSTATSNVTHKWVDPTDSQTHHQHSHSGPSSLYQLGANLYDPTGYNPPGAGITAQPLYDTQLAEIDLFYAQQVNYLAQKLNSFGLLDKSVICWGSELDMGQAHNHDATPFVLIGSAGGALKTGQLLQFPLNLPGNTATTNNRFHNDLLITLAKAMGVNLSTFGTAAGPTTDRANVPYVTGPITQMLA